MARERPRWYCPTPDKLLMALLPVVGLLWLSERFGWFALNEHKNWTVLIAAAVVCAAIAILPLWLGVSLVFRRRFQFGLRSLLVLVTVVAVVCSWFSVKMRQAEKQRKAVEVIVGTGGDVRYDYEFVSAMSPAGPDLPGPPWLGSLLGVDFLSDPLGVTYRAAKDADLVHLKELPSLQYLHLKGTQVSDAGLMHLKGLASLQTLRLEGTRVTDAGLVHLKGLSNLYWLVLETPPVTGAGLVHLKGLTNLEGLVHPSPLSYSG